jgi:hypothetical protein
LIRGGSTFDILTADSITYYSVSDRTHSFLQCLPRCHRDRWRWPPGSSPRGCAASGSLFGLPRLYNAGAFNGDDDFDGLLNGVEYLLGLLPNDPNGGDGAAGAPV